MNNIPKPTYAYVPGVNARHPEDWFDPIKHDVMPGMTEVDMQKSHAWRAGMLYRQGRVFLGVPRSIGTLVVGRTARNAP